MEEYRIRPGRSRQSSQMDLDAIVLKAFRAAVNTGKDVTRVEQALRYNKLGGAKVK